MAKPNPEVKSLIRDGYISGRTAREIAQELGYNPQSVRAYFSLLKAEGVPKGEPQGWMRKGRKKNEPA